MLACGLAGLVGWQATRHGPPIVPSPTEALAALTVEVQGGEQQPIAGARVSALAGTWHQSGATDASGRVRFNACPRVHVTLQVEAAGWARDRRSLALSASTVASIALAPGAVLSGRVHDESDRPVAEAQVVARVIAGGAQEPWSVLSGPDGRFVIDTLPPARVTLEVGDGGHHEPAIVAEIALPSAELVDVLLRRTAHLAGRVTNPLGKPAAGAQVTLAGSGVWPARTADTSPAGEFKFDGVPEGIYELRAELAGAISVPVEGISVNPGNEARVELALEQGVTLRGLARDIATGRALPEAEVEVVEDALSATPKHGRALADGAFQIAPLRPVAQRVTVRARGYVTLQTWLTPTGSVFTAELLRAVTISGSVEDADGRAVGHAQLEVSGRSETGYAVHMLGPINEPAAAVLIDGAQGSGAGPANLGVTRGSVPRIPLDSNSPESGAAVLPQFGDLGFRSDEQGHFRLEGLPPGELVLTAHKLGFGPGRSRSLTARAGTSVEDVSIVLQRGVALTGRVVDGHGMPVPHVRVDWSAANEPARSTVTADDGGFRFDGVRGPCAVQARAAGAPLARVEVSAQDVGQRELELVLESSSERLLGRVLDTREQPIEAASIHLETGRGRTFSATALSGRDGTFEFDALPAPPYVVQAEHPDYTPSGEQHVVSTGKPLLVRLEAGADLTGLVFAAQDGEPIVGARISIRASGVSRSARSIRDGTFEFRHLPLGDYTLFIDAERFVSSQRQSRLEAATGRPILERIELARAGAVAGDVVDRHGATVWNAEVATGSPPDWERAVRTDHSGHFEVSGLPAGEHLVSARRAGKLVTTASPVRVYEGQATPGVVLRLDAVVDDTQEATER